MKNSIIRMMYLVLTISVLFIPVLTAFCQVNVTTTSKTLKSNGYAPVNGLKMYYEVHGEGQPLVLIHGSYMTIDLNLGQIIPELAKSHKVIALEMQGHGRTADIERPISYKALASDVAGLLKHLKIDKADILGYSLGGTVAFQLAIQNPEVINKMVILSTTYKYKGWRPELLELLRTMTPGMFDNTPLKTEYDRVAPQPQYWPNFVKKYMEFDKMDFDLGEANIKAISSPVLLIMGDNDGVDLVHKATMYRLLGGDTFADISGLPKSQLAILPGTTHVSLMMQTEKLLSIIIPFLENSQEKTNQH